MRSFRSLVTIITGPAVFLVSLHLGYVLVTRACSQRSAGLMLFAALLALGVMLASALVAWRLWVLTGGAHVDDPVPQGRGSFLWLTVLGTSLFSALAVLIGVLPLMVLSPEAPGRYELFDETEENCREVRRR
jgi:hypothetical protein